MQAMKIEWRDDNLWKDSLVRYFIPSVPLFQRLLPALEWTGVEMKINELEKLLLINC